MISDGIKGIFATAARRAAARRGGPIATGDLPTATGTRNRGRRAHCRRAAASPANRSASNSDLEGLPPASPPCGFAGAGAEGTALLEIVHDLAPGAQLSFANARHRSGVQPGRQLPRRVERHRGGRPRILRRAVRRHEQRVGQHGRGAQQPVESHSRLRHVGRQRRRRALHRGLRWTRASTALAIERHLDARASAPLSALGRHDRRARPRRPAVQPDLAAERRRSR